MNYLEQIQKHCVVEHAAAADLSPEAFALLRKMGLGASDTSVFLGTMSAFNKTTDSLISDKLTMFYTEQDKEISNKSSVRMGRDLEDLVLQKAEAALERPVVKAPEMFRMKLYPYLTMNLDGVSEEPDGIFVPVEAKVVTTFGDKYYDWDKAIISYSKEPTFTGSHTKAEDRAAYITQLAEIVGIPAYYYVQVQHELLGMGASYGYLAALRIKDWQLYLFGVVANPVIQSWIITEGNAVWQRIEKLRKMGHG